MIGSFTRAATSSRRSTSTRGRQYHPSPMSTASTASNDVIIKAFEVECPSGMSVVSGGASATSIGPVGDVLTRKSVAELYQLSPSATCVNYYGSTETQRSVSYHVLERESTLAAMRAAETGLAADKAVLPLGRGIEGVQLLVLPVGEGLEGGEPPLQL